MSRKLTLWRVVAAVLVVAMMTLTACGPQPTEAPTSAPEPTEKPAEPEPTEAPAAEEPESEPEAEVEAEPEAEVVRVAYVPAMLFAASYVAEGRGYFDELGLDVQFEKVKSGTEAVAFLSEGQVDVGAIAVVASTWNAFSQGLDLRVVASAGLKRMKDDPTMLMVRKDLWESGEVTTAADLAGRTVAAAGGPGSGGEYLLSKALETGGLSIFDVEMVNVGNADMPAAMESQSVEAALTGSPYATAMEEAGTAVPLVKDMAPGAMTVVYVYSGKFMQERPETAQKFMMGLMKGARALQGDEYLCDENMASYLQFVSSTEDVIRKAPKSLYDPNLGLRTETLMDAQETHMKNGRLEYDTPIPVEDVVDPTWLEYAVEEMGRWEPPALDPPEKVRVAYVPATLFAASYVAEGRGYFDEMGLDVEFEKVTSGTEAVAFLSEGQVDVGAIAVVASTWNAFSQGLDLRVVASAGLKQMKDDPTMLVVRKDLWDSGEVQTASDLAGRTVAVAGGPGSGGEYLLSKALETDGLSIFDVELVNVGNPDMPAAMESQAIDASLTGAPYVTQMVEAGTAVPLVKDMVPGAMTVVFVYSGKFMEERPEAAQRFTVGLMKGARAIQGESYLDDENVAAILQFVSSTEEILRKSPRSLYDPDVALRTDTLMDAQETHMKNGRLEYDTPIPVGSVVDPSWQEYALMVLGPYNP